MASSSTQTVSEQTKTEKKETRSHLSLKMYLLGIATIIVPLLVFYVIAALVAPVRSGWNSLFIID
uniref:Uncharacterized protein n=1 Tax=viral metagenome TaxID=1070528 RepID=A0A6C0JY09_9ZZZZ